MKYYLKPHVTDEMLKAVGFVITDNSYNNGIGFESYFEALRRFSERYEVVLQNREKPLAIYIYDWRDNMYLNETFGDDVDVSRFIKDLINLGYVEVRND